VSSSNVFYPFELCIFEKLKSLLGKEGGLILQKQIDVINKVQRFAKGKEVNLYQMKWGKSAFDDTLCFPNKEAEVLLATASLSGESKETIKLKVWLVKGRIFSLTFNKSPENLSITSSSQILDMKIVNNPMELNSSENLDFADTALPKDFVKNSDFRTREIIFDDDNYYVLTEMAYGVIAVKSGSYDGGLYLLQYEDENIKTLGTSFKEALEKVKKQQEKER
jgi:hypothetical protein